MITDGRILRAICLKYGFTYDKVHKYITKDRNYIGNLKYKDKIYRLKYFDGCFYPFIVEIV